MMESKICATCQTMKIIVNGKCQPAGSKRFMGLRGGKGVIIDDNPRASDWKLQVAEAAAKARDEAGWPLLRGPLRLSAYFYRARPSSHWTARSKIDGLPNLKASAPLYPATKPDRGKLLRAVEDALEGILYANDSQIVSGSVQKRWGESDYVEILVQPLDEK